MLQSWLQTAILITMVQLRQTAHNTAERSHSKVGTLSRSLLRKRPKKSTTNLTRARHLDAKARLWASVLRDKKSVKSLSSLTAHLRDPRSDSRSSKAILIFSTDRKRPSKTRSSKTGTLVDSNPSESPPMTCLQETPLKSPRMMQALSLLTSQRNHCQEVASRNLSKAVSLAKRVGARVITCLEASLESETTLLALTQCPELALIRAKRALSRVW